MAVIATQHTTAGVAPTFQAASVGGDTYVATGSPTLRVKNGSASSITVTITAINPCNQGSLHPLTFTVTAGQEYDYGPVDVAHYMDSSGNVEISYSAVTSITVAVTAA